jgi:hypothetical protein
MMKARMFLAAVAAAGFAVAPALAQQTGNLGGKPGATQPTKPSTPAQPSKPTTTGQPTTPKPGDTPVGMPSMDEMMKLMGPGAEHQQLMQQFEGTWDTTCTFQMAPGQPENTSTGTSENHMVLGGRYLTQHFRGTMSMPGMGEMPFEGMGYTGFDRAKKEWFSTWIDSMGTGQMQSTGTYDAAAKTYTYKGSYEDPAKGHVDVREVIRVESPDRHVMEFYMPGENGQPDFKSMTITYTRAKGGDTGMGRSNAPTTTTGAGGKTPGVTTPAPKTGGKP